MGGKRERWVKVEGKVLVSKVLNSKTKVTGTGRTKMVLLCLHHLSWVDGGL